MLKKSSEIRQLESKIEKFARAGSDTLPNGGWVKAIRNALGMSARQLGKRLNLTRQGIHEIEKREADGSITIKALRETAEALEMKLVYGFIPIDGSLEALIEKKARVLALQIVHRTNISMKLEQQEIAPQKIAYAIEERTNMIKEEMPKTLWE